MPAHIHAELMKQYAEDATTTDRPWELWECRGDDGPHWTQMAGGNPLWCIGIQYRRKPRTININGHEVPEPMRVEPKRGASYWVIDPSGEDLCECMEWDGDSFDLRQLARGHCHSTQEAAEAHARALLSFTEAKA